MSPYHYNFSHPCNFFPRYFFNENNVLSLQSSGQKTYANSLTKPFKALQLEQVQIHIKLSEMIIMLGNIIIIKK